jgi:riboflavin synthase
MFTGLIEDVGTIERSSPTVAGREFRVRCRYDDLAEGESIAVNGACLTVREAAPRVFSAAAVVTTLGRTTMGEWGEGTMVNLERAVRLGDRLGGHLVQGHVDGVGVVESCVRVGDALLIDIRLPADVEEIVVPRGSIAVDGVSLTVNALPRSRSVQVSIIDYTERHTTLGRLTPGDRVHLEFDLIGKYVRGIMTGYLNQPEGR